MSKLQVFLVGAGIVTVFSLTTTRILREDVLDKVETSEVSLMSAVVSIPELVTYPEKYNGKKVSVVGYCHLEFEGNRLQLHKDTQDNNKNLDRVWLSLPESAPFELRKNNGKRVVVEGVFNAKVKGHFGMFPGAIEQITDIKEVTLK